MTNDAKEDEPISVQAALLPLRISSVEVPG